MNDETMVIELFGRYFTLKWNTLCVIEIDSYACEIAWRRDYLDMMCFHYYKENYREGMRETLHSLPDLEKAIFSDIDSKLQYVMNAACEPDMEYVAKLESEYSALKQSWN